MKTWKEFNMCEVVANTENAVLDIIIKHGIKSKGKLEVQQDGDVRYVSINAKLNQATLKALSKHSITVVGGESPNTFDIIFV